MVAITLVMIILAYLAGSVSSAVVIAKLYRLPDPRYTGSGNPGATNMLRIGGAMPASLVLLGDLLKGTIPVWGSYFLDLPPLALGVVAVSACLGHIFPIFFEFKGGKGVATALGAMLPIGLDLGGLLFGTWLLVALTSGYSSLASITVAVFSPLFTYLIKPQYTYPVAMLGLLIIIRHHANIRRLFKKEEPKIWNKFKKK